MNTCYECGKEAKFQLKNGQWCCSTNRNSCLKIREAKAESIRKSWVLRKQQDFVPKYQKPEQHTKTELCEYGCGNKAEFQLKNGQWCCSKHSGSCLVNRQKNAEGLKLAYVEGRKDRENLNKNAPEWHGWSKGKCQIKLDSEELNRIFCITTIPQSGQYLKKRILRANLKEYKCDICGISEWKSKPLHLQLDHINGNKIDNRLENLRFICPNCHSQTDTFCTGLRQGRYKIVSDELLLQSYNESATISEALLKVGLTSNNGNYVRLRKLLENKNASVGEQKTQPA